MPLIDYRARIATAGIILVILGATVGCRGAAADSVKGPVMTDPKPAATVTGDAAILLTGTRIPGVTCPAILLADGTEVGLSHLPSDLPIGARIEVAGSGYVVSMTCQARVLAVTSAKRVDD